VAIQIDGLLPPSPRLRRTGRRCASRHENQKKNVGQARLHVPVFRDIVSRSDDFVLMIVLLLVIDGSEYEHDYDYDHEQESSVGCGSRGVKFSG